MRAPLPHRNPAAAAKREPSATPEDVASARELELDLAREESRELPNDAATSSPPLDLRSVFEEHVDHVGNSLRRLGVREADIPDLVQEVFVVMHRILPDYDASRPLWPWIFGVVYRTAAAYRRKAAREVLDDGTLSAARVDSSANIEEAVRKDEDRQLVLQALESIELHRRAVFVMADIDEVPVPEIARALGIGLNTAYSRLRLARDEFRAAAARLLKRRGDR